MFESLSGLPSTRVREGRVSSLLRASSGDSHSSCGFLFDNSEKEAMPLSAFKLTCFLLGAPISSPFSWVLKLSAFNPKWTFGSGTIKKG